RSFVSVAALAELAGNHGERLSRNLPLQRHGLLTQILINQSGHQLTKTLAALSQEKFLILFRPVELEAGGKRRNPDLSDRGVGRDYEARTIVKSDVQGSGLIFHLDAGGFFRDEQGLLQL